MKQEHIIRHAIENARSAGIALRRGATFDWTKPGTDGVPARAPSPTACNATGAVLLAMGRRMSPGWLAALCAYLDVDGFWLWRFWQGFDRDYQVQAWDERKQVWVDDEVSHMGRRLARELAE